MVKWISIIVAKVVYKHKNCPNSFLDFVHISRLLCWSTAQKRYFRLWYQIIWVKFHYQAHTLLIFSVVTSFCQQCLEHCYYLMILLRRPFVTTTHTWSWHEWHLTCLVRLSLLCRCSATWQEAAPPTVQATWFAHSLRSLFSEWDWRDLRNPVEMIYGVVPRSAVACPRSALSIGTISGRSSASPSDTPCASALSSPWFCVVVLWFRRLGPGSAREWPFYCRESFSCCFVCPIGTGSGAQSPSSSATHYAIASRESALLWLVAFVGRRRPSSRCLVSSFAPSLPPSLALLFSHWCTFASGSSVSANSWLASCRCLRACSGRSSSSVRWPCLPDPQGRSAPSCCHRYYYCWFRSRLTCSGRCETSLQLLDSSFLAFCLLFNRKL